MAHTWYDLTKLTGTADFTVQKVRLTASEIAIEGNFELPPMAKMSYEDQIFVAQFIKAHGSIKQMEELFGVSYPTIKSRLNKIGSQLNFIEVINKPDANDVLDKLERGEITPEKAIESLRE